MMSHGSTLRSREHRRGGSGDMVYVGAKLLELTVSASRIRGMKWQCNLTSELEGRAVPLAAVLAGA